MATTKEQTIIIAYSVFYRFLNDPKTLIKLHDLRKRRFDLAFKSFVALDIMDEIRAELENDNMLSEMAESFISVFSSRLETFYFDNLYIALTKATSKASNNRFAPNNFLATLNEYAKHYLPQADNDYESAIESFANDEMVKAAESLIADGWIDNDVYYKFPQVLNEFRSEFKEKMLELHSIYVEPGQKKDDVGWSSLLGHTPKASNIIYELQKNATLLDANNENNMAALLDETMFVLAQTPRNMVPDVLTLATAIATTSNRLLANVNMLRGQNLPALPANNNAFIQQSLNGLSNAIHRLYQLLKQPNI